MIFYNTDEVRIFLLWTADAISMSNVPRNDARHAKNSLVEERWCQVGREGLGVRTKERGRDREGKSEV